MPALAFLLPLCLSVSLAVAAVSGAGRQPATANPTQIGDIRGPLPLETSLPFARSAGALLVVAGVLLAGRVWRRRRRARKRVSLPAGTGDGEPVLALARLKEEFARGMLSNEHVVLTVEEILRTTLHAQQDLPVAALTSRELVAQAWFSGEAQAKFARLLDLADRVKFARHQPRDDEAEWVLTVAGDLLLAASSG